VVYFLFHNHTSRESARLCAGETPYEQGGVHTMTVIGKSTVWPRPQGACR